MSYLDDILATRRLTNEAMSYAAEAIVMPAKQSPLGAIDDARQIATDAGGAPLVSSVMADALRDLQMAALVFAINAAIANYRADLSDLDALGEKLFDKLKERGAVRMSLVPDVVSAAQTLGASALDYAREIVAAEDNKTPIGSDAVQRALSKLQLASIAFTVRLAIAEGYERKRLRRIEKKLVSLFAYQEIGR